MDEAVIKRLVKLDDDFLRCRMGHRWMNPRDRAKPDPQVYWWVEGKERFIVLKYTCHGCGQWKEDVFTPAGEHVTTYRGYPEDYIFVYTELERKSRPRVTTRNAAAVFIQRAIRQGRVASSEDSTH